MSIIPTHATLVAMVSSGDRQLYHSVTFPRIAAWASRHRYSVILVRDALAASDRLPHYGKLRVPAAFPGYDRYLIVDDDLLISQTAPELPPVPPTLVGLVPDAVQTNTTNPIVRWTANTGFILVGSDAVDLLEEAYAHGDAPDIWGVADQGALNAVAWKKNRVFELDSRWNYQPVVDFFHNRSGGWDKWITSRWHRISYYLGISTRLRWRSRRRLREAYGLHLTRARHPRFFDRHLP